MNATDVYRRLQVEINKMPIAYSETESGVELRLLKHLFTPEEAEIALNLNVLPESLARIHKRSGRNGITLGRQELKEKLDHLVEKGAILGTLSDKKGMQYSLAQLAIGMFEFQLNRLTSEFVHDFEAYVKEQFHKDVLRTKTQQMRTIPISKSLTPDLRVEPYNDIKGYVRGLKEDIAVANCVCRQSKEVIGGTCTHSNIRETCLLFSDFARFTVANGKARSITNAEAIASLDRAEGAGFVLQPQNAREPKFVCCCCIDCCHALKLIRMHPKPAELFTSDYYVTVDPQKCKDCKKCVDRCGMQAISMEGKTAVVNHDRCIGCGACVTVCANDAHQLHKKDRPFIPPKTQDDLYKQIMIERFGLVGTLKTVARVVTGRKA